MARRKLGIERNQLTSLEGQHAQIANTRDEVIKIAKKFYKRWSRWLIDRPIQGFRRFPTRDINNTFYQMLEHMFRTKNLEK